MPRSSCPMMLCRFALLLCGHAINCGQLQASSCNVCPNVMSWGPTWCQGDCTYCNSEQKCTGRNTQCSSVTVNNNPPAQGTYFIKQTVDAVYSSGPSDPQIVPTDDYLSDTEKKDIATLMLRANWTELDEQLDKQQMSGQEKKDCKDLLKLGRSEIELIATSSTSRLRRRLGIRTGNAALGHAGRIIMKVFKKTFFPGYLLGAGMFAFSRGRKPGKQFNLGELAWHFLGPLLPGPLSAVYTAVESYKLIDKTVKEIRRTGNVGLDDMLAFGIVGLDLLSVVAPVPQLWPFQVGLKLVKDLELLESNEGHPIFRFANENPTLKQGWSNHFRNNKRYKSNYWSRAVENTRNHVYTHSYALGQRSKCGWNCVSQIQQNYHHRFVNSKSVSRSHRRVAQMVYRQRQRRPAPRPRRHRRFNPITALRNNIGGAIVAASRFIHGIFGRRKLQGMEECDSKKWFEWLEYDGETRREVTWFPTSDYKKGSKVPTADRGKIIAQCRMEDDEELLDEVEENDADAKKRAECETRGSHWVAFPGKLLTSDGVEFDKKYATVEECMFACYHHVTEPALVVHTATGKCQCSTVCPNGFCEPQKASKHFHDAKNADTTLYYRVPASVYFLKKIDYETDFNSSSEGQQRHDLLRFPLDGFCDVGLPPVLCGDHRAVSCAQCPNGFGSKLCGGQCKWCDTASTCQPKELEC